MSGGRLQADPLFQGLTRPAMLLGVSYTFMVVNFMVIMVVFLNTKNPAMIFMALPVHGVGYLICMREPRAIELLLVKTARTLRCRNKLFHDFTNSYDSF
jgi:type IV secretion system protein VirB3